MGFDFLVVNIGCVIVFFLFVGFGLEFCRVGECLVLEMCEFCDENVFFFDLFFLFVCLIRVLINCFFFGVFFGWFWGIGLGVEVGRDVGLILIGGRGFEEDDCGLERCIGICVFLGLGFLEDLFFVLMFRFFKILVVFIEKRGVVGGGVFCIWIFCLGVCWDLGIIEDLFFGFDCWVIGLGEGVFLGDNFGVE